jgi:tripartite-type tricarboxylate transporter receptor subunit TctC
MHTTQKTTPPQTPAAIGRRQLLGAAAAAALALAANPGRAQAAFPTKPITIIVPYTAGGASDIGARLLGVELGRLLGQPVVIDNVGGAGGAVGVQKMLRAPADGYTLLYGSLSECVLVPLINASAGYKPEDMTAVAMAGAAPASFVVRPDFPANNMEEWIAYARKNPGRLSYGSPGIGTFQHLVAETIKAKTGTFMLHIPYRGGANIVSDVISGQIDIGVTTSTNVLGMGVQGRVKVLGITSAERVPALPNVPAFGDTPALKGMDLQTWAMVFAPKGVPDAVLQKLNSVITGVVMSPAMGEQRRRLGSTLAGPFTPAQAQAFLLNERDTYRLAASRIKPE